MRLQRTIAVLLAVILAVPAMVWAAPFVSDSTDSMQHGHGHHTAAAELDQAAETNPTAKCHDGKHHCPIGLDCCEACVQAALLSPYSIAVWSGGNDHTSVSTGRPQLNSRPQLHPPRS